MWTSGWGVRVAAVAIWLCLSLPATHAQSGFSPDQQALLTIKRAVTNWDLYYRRSTCTGWVEEPGSDVCTWTGVVCQNGTVVVLRFADNGFQHAGDIGDILYGASLLQNLVRLHLVGQGFTGTLPQSVAFPKLYHINLGYNYLQGTLPESWGQNGALPVLRDLFLAFNGGLSGTLPAGWGADGTSLAGLQRLQITNTNLTGSLPNAWAAQMPGLRYLDVSGNALSGPLPPGWSRLNTTVLNLGRNVLTGTIPPAWAGPSAFRKLKDLQLCDNLLSGTIPATWYNVSATNLSWVNVANNNFTEPVSTNQTDSTDQVTLISSAGKLMCMQLPPAASLYYCAATEDSCGQDTGARPAGCPATLMSPSTVSSNTTAAGSGSDRAALLRMAAAFANWAEADRAELLGWASGAPMCGPGGWRGVTCSVAGSVIGVDLGVPAPLAVAGLMSVDEMMRSNNPFPPLDITVPGPGGGTLPSPGGNASASAAAAAADALPANVTLRGSSPVQLQGNIAAVLQAASALPQLQALDLGNQLLTGQLPAAITFPNLQSLRLSGTKLTGSLPPEWAQPTALPALRYLDLSGNFFLSGQLPPAWGANNSLQKLEALMLPGCNLVGGLPVAWAQNLPGLGALDLTNNNLTGTLPPEWQTMGSMQSLSLVGNALTGTLPAQWASSGANSWPELRQLHLRSNLIHGPLPGGWGNASSLPALQNLTLSGNQLSGPIPPFWGGTHFPHLQSIMLLPGNQGLCGPIPASLTVLAANGVTVDPAVDLNGIACPGAAAEPTPSSGGGGGGNSSALIGGIIGGLAGLAIALGVAAFLVCRRQRGRMRLSSLTNGSELKPISVFKAPSPPHDSDSFIVPYAPRSDATGSGSGSNPPSSSGGPPRSSIVPYSQAPFSRTSASSITATGSVGSQDMPSSLPHIVGKDWELDLDALEIELDENEDEVVLGHGAFGVVVKGRYRLAPVAIKRLREQSVEQQTQFLREMAILRACRGSRHIVPFVGASIAPGNTILVMDFMEMGTLWEQLPRKNKRGENIFQWHHRGRKVAYEVALGLHSLHELRMVHLDLKSSNVLLGSDATAKISDVGLAAQLSKSYIGKMVPAGTFAWVAPEVILGGRVTQKADVYSFGVILWEIVTLERPTWPRGNMRTPSVPEECQQEVADLIQRCFLESEQRPDAAECASVIAAFLPPGTRLGSSRSASGGVARTRSNGVARSPSGGGGGLARAISGSGVARTPSGSS